MPESFALRPATPADASALRAIYQPYVLDTAITFEYDVPSAAEFAQRVRHTLEKYPFLVAEEAGAIVGYAYAGPFHARAAYDWAAETSVYVRADCKGRGVGRALYQRLEECLAQQRICNAYACIAYAQHEDGRLTNASMRFHERLGYRLVGTFHQCGYKFGQWYDVIWMEKFLGGHPPAPAPVLPFSRAVTPLPLPAAPRSGACSSERNTGSQKAP